MWQTAIAISLLSAMLLVTHGAAEQDSDAECPATRKLEVVAAIAPAAGAYPVWAVDGSYGIWGGPEVRVKTAWILARDHAGDLMVVGKRLDADGRALFAAPGDASLSHRLFIANANAQQMMPGGIEPGQLRKYSFRSSMIVYPSAGCWELLVRYGESESRIVLELTEQP